MQRNPLVLKDTVKTKKVVGDDFILLLHKLLMIKLYYLS